MVQYLPPPFPNDHLLDVHYRFLPEQSAAFDTGLHHRRVLVHAGGVWASQVHLPLIKMATKKQPGQILALLNSWNPPYPAERPRSLGLPAISVCTDLYFPSSHFFKGNQHR